MSRLPQIPNELRPSHWPRLWYFFENKENPEPTLAPAINIYKYVSLYVSYIDIQHLDDISL